MSSDALRIQEQEKKNARITAREVVAFEEGVSGIRTHDVRAFALKYPAKVTAFDRSAITPYS